MIYVFLAEGFEITEALTTVDVLRRANLNVATVGVNSKSVTSSCNITVESDITIEQVDLTVADAIVLPGGMPGTLNLEKSQMVQDAIDYCADNNKFICAICAAPSILGHKGLLNNKCATCYPGFEVNEDVVNYTGAPAVACDKIITGKGAGCTIEFALLITEKLLSKDIADEVKGSMQCQ